MVCPKFNLPTHDFIFDTLLTCASLRYHSITHLIFCRYSNKFLIKNTTHERSNTPISKKHTPMPTVLTKQWSRGYNASFRRDWTETQLGFDRATTSRKSKAEFGFIFVKWYFFIYGYQSISLFLVSSWHFRASSLFFFYFNMLYLFDSR